MKDLCQEIMKDLYRTGFPVHLLHRHNITDTNSFSMLIINADWFTFLGTSQHSRVTRNIKSLLNWALLLYLVHVYVMGGYPAETLVRCTVA